MPPRFQRARKPEEKEVRRRAILKAARRLTTEVGSVDFSLSELARRSGVSKPNVYRYFESREEVLLQVWIDEVRDLTAHMEIALAKTPVGDIPALTAVIVAAFAAQPRLGELTAICAPVLERNLSEEAIVAAKTTLATLSLELGKILHARLPALTLEDCVWISGTIGVYIAGIWPATNPGPVAAKALARPELAGMQPVFERDFTRFLQVLFAGVTRRPA